MLPTKKSVFDNHSDTAAFVVVLFETRTVLSEGILLTLEARDMAW